jgi:hypothetical protein
MKNVLILSRVGMTIDGGLDWMIEFIGTLYIQLGATDSCIATAICALYSSLLHPH